MCVTPPQVLHASSAVCTFSIAVSRVNGGSGERISVLMNQLSGLCGCVPPHAGGSVSSEGPDGQEFAVEGDYGAFAALGVRDLFHVELEVHRAEYGLAQLLLGQL